MSHQIGSTDRVTLEGRTFDVELRPHHRGETYSKCEVDCPEGWQIPIYSLLQGMRNNPEYKERFGLLMISEFVQNPDEISRQKGLAAWFFANSAGAGLSCFRDPQNKSPLLGVRYAREISQGQPNPDKPIDPDGTGDYQTH